MKTIETTKHRLRSLGSTNMVDLMGNGYAHGGPNQVFAEKVEGLSQDLGSLGDLGQRFEMPIAEDGFDRFIELSGLDRGQFGEMIQLGQGETLVKPIIPEEVFGPEELAELSNEFGPCVYQEIPANSTPDIRFSGDDKVGMEVKLRIFKGEKTMDQKPVYRDDLPGSGSVYYGEEMTNEVLPGEYDQNQWHMRAANWNWMIHAAAKSLAPDEVRVWVVKRDDERIREMEKVACFFAWDHLFPFWDEGRKVYPSVDESDWCRIIQNLREPAKDLSATFAEVKGFQVQETCEKILEMQARIKSQTKDLAEAKNMVRAALEGRQVGLTSRYRITNKPNKNGTKTLRIKEMK